MSISDDFNIYLAWLMRDRKCNNATKQTSTLNKFNGNFINNYEYFWLFCKRFTDIIIEI